MSEIYDYLQNEVNDSTKIPVDTITMIPGTDILKPTSKDFFRIAFPFLYPNGLGHYQSRTVQKVSFDEEIKHRLCMGDNSFRHDFMFQFLAYDIIQKRHIYYRIKNMTPASQDHLQTYHWRIFRRQ